jgi:hypothetical protein
MKPYAFIITDVETTKRDGICFDVGFTTVDRKDNLLGSGSYIFNDVLQKDNPFFKHKIAQYWEMAYERKVKPVPFTEFRDIYNEHIDGLRVAGFDPVICAYNAKFDTSRLSLTSNKMLGEKFLTSTGIKILDIWDAWAMSCPRKYVAEISKAGNVRTNAESVYAFEMGVPGFIEDHTGYADTLIEKEILFKVLARKKKLPIVTNPADLRGDPWRVVQQRVNWEHLRKVAQCEV